MINLIDGYKVIVDDYNYTLVFDTGRTQIFKNKDGTEVEKPVLKYLGYYMSLYSAINACRQKLVRDELKDGSFSLYEAVYIIKKVTDRFTEVLERCLPEDDLK